MSTRMLVAILVAVPLAGLAAVIALLVGSGGDDSRPTAAVSEEAGSTQASTTAVPAPAVSRAGVSSVERVETDPRFFRVVRKLIPKDAIAPIYDPAFVSAGQSSLNDTDYVVGLSIAGDARAYSVALLNGREMVNDVVGGVPVLVTW